MKAERFSVVWQCGADLSFLISSIFNLMIGFFRIVELSEYNNHKNIYLIGYQPIFNWGISNLKKNYFYPSLVHLSTGDFCVSAAQIERYFQNATHSTHMNQSYMNLHVQHIKAALTFFITLLCPSYQACKSKNGRIRLLCHLLVPSAVLLSKAEGDCGRFVRPLSDPRRRGRIIPVQFKTDGRVRASCIEWPKL